MKSGGGFKAIKYSLNVARIVGFKKLFTTMFSKNSCKTCAYGMGGQKGGMTDEMDRFPEVCKKSFQAQISDIQTAISDKFITNNSISDLREKSSRILEKLGRLNSPIYKAEGDTHYSTISWEDAIAKVSSKFKSVEPEKSFFYSSGRSSNETGFLLQLFARLYGSNNISNSAYYCHQASGVGINSAIGTGTATVNLSDLEEADLIFIIGANPASNHPRFMRQLYNCRKRGGNVVVINPAKEKGLVRFAVPSNIKSIVEGGSEIASEYLQIKIGSDIALLKGIAKAIIEKEMHNTKFIENYTNGSSEYIEDVNKTNWDKIVSTSGIPKEKIETIADMYGSAKNVIFSWALGITHHVHGVENVESIVNLALLRGMIGRRFAGLLPLRGQSNVQGIGSVGVTPALKEVVFNNIERELNVQLPTTTGMDTMSSMKAAYNKNINLAFLLGGNLFSANPDAHFAEEALNNIPFKIFLTTTLNKSHFVGVDKEVVILPVLARDEETQKTTQESMFNYIRMSDGGIPRLSNARSETSIISDIAQGVLGNGKVNFESLKLHKNLRTLISKIIPGFQKLNDIDNSNKEFQISNRTLHEAKFNTPNQKANFRICSIPILNKNEYRMMTVRSEGQFNTIVYEEEDIYREQTSRWIVMMNEEDISIKGLKENDLVTIKSSVGKMENVTVRKFNIPRGNIITYYPEANILVPTTTDPRSKTPAYKSVGVKII